MRFKRSWKRGSESSGLAGLTRRGYEAVVREFAKARGLKALGVAEFKIVPGRGGRPLHWAFGADALKVGEKSRIAAARRSESTYKTRLSWPMNTKGEGCAATRRAVKGSFPRIDNHSTGEQCESWFTRFAFDKSDRAS